MKIKFCKLIDLYKMQCLPNMISKILSRLIFLLLKVKFNLPIEYQVLLNINNPSIIDKILSRLYKIWIMILLSKRILKTNNMLYQLKVPHWVNQKNLLSNLELIPIPIANPQQDNLLMKAVFTTSSTSHHLIFTLWRR